MKFNPIPFNRSTTRLRPDTMDLSKYDSPGSQQLLGSCTGDAVIALYENLLNQKGPEYSVRLSRLWVWYYARKSIGLENTTYGTHTKEAVKALASYGVCLEKDWSYIESNATIVPLGGITAKGKPYEISKIYSHPDTESVLDRITLGYPVVITTNTGIRGSNHAMLAIGYKDKGSILLVKDSNRDENASFYKRIPVSSIIEGDSWSFDLLDPPVVNKWLKYRVVRFLIWLRDTVF